jgi:uncharacterized protein (TIGR03067 family)
MDPLLGFSAVVVLLPLVRGACHGDADSSGSADRIAALVAQLGDDKFARREAAGRALAAAGRPALPALRAAAGGSDPEVQQRAEALVADITRRAGEAELARWAGSWAGPTGSKLTIEGDRFVSAAPGDGSFRGVLRVVGFVGDTVEADLEIDLADGEVMTAKGIFRLDGDTLHYCGNDPGQPRPTEFKSDGTKYYVPWKRAKK